MSNGNGQMQTEFHNRANAVYISVCQAFEDAVANVSRRNEEFKFQQLKKQYAHTLDQQLQGAAKEVLSKYRNEKQVHSLDLMFMQSVKDYLHRFIQKVNDL